MGYSKLERALDADGYYIPDDAKFSPRTAAERRADRRDKHRRELMLTRSEDLDPSIWDSVRIAGTEENE